MQATDIGPMSADEPSSLKVEQDNHNKMPDGPAVIHQKP